MEREGLAIPQGTAALPVAVPSTDEDYLAIDATLSEAFAGEFAASPEGAARLRRVQEHGGAVRFVRAPDGGCAGGATCSAPAVGAAELAGVGAEREDGEGRAVLRTPLFRPSSALFGPAPGPAAPGPTGQDLPGRGLPGGRRLQLVHACGHHRADMGREVLERPVPPGQGQQPGDVRVVVAAADEPGRVAADDAVVGNVVHHHGTGGDDRPMADADAGHHRRPVAEPDIVAHHGVAPPRQTGDQVEMVGP
ncbi:hypothetical protein SMALB_3180 [Streptomyces malaysiensis]|uniref:Uncharacterized protein n=1 Tax=Streptomyces malaysiensis TaxID=92644 RepID=A0A7X6AXN4_STRMQ|nr:hypothetical protein [Streptomyces malaysiensis]